MYETIKHSSYLSELTKNFMLKLYNVNKVKHFIHFQKLRLYLSYMYVKIVFFSNAALAIEVPNLEIVDEVRILICNSKMI